MNVRETIDAADALTALLGKLSPDTGDLYVTLGSTGIGIQVTRHGGHISDSERAATVRGIATHLDRARRHNLSPSSDGFSTTYMIRGTFREQPVEVYTALRAEVLA